MITDLQMILRIFLAALCGALVGVEREYHNQLAGLRTHIILSIGAALAMYISINLSIQLYPEAVSGDPARLAAQVISGIGFLGAGAIFRYGATTKGLTTATSLWAIAIVGLAMGAGYFIAGFIATFLLLFSLVTLDVVQKRFIILNIPRTIRLKTKDRPALIEDIKNMFNNLGIEVKSISVTKLVETEEIEIETIAKVPTKQNFDHLIKELSDMKNTSLFEVH